VNEADQRWLNALMLISRDLPRTFRTRMASCMVHKGRVVAWGFNQAKSHPLAARFCKHSEAIFLHAELDCIRNATRVLDQRGLGRSTLYTVRVKRAESEGRTMVQGLAKPCKGCAAAIAAFGIGRAVWSTEGQGFSCTAVEEIA